MAAEETAATQRKGRQMSTDAPGGNSRSGYRLDWMISVDDHILEPPGIWRDRLPARYLEAGPQVVVKDGTECWRYEGRLFPASGLSAVAGKKYEDEAQPQGPAASVDPLVRPPMGSALGGTSGDRPAPAHALRLVLEHVKNGRRCALPGLPGREQLHPADLDDAGLDLQRHPGQVPRPEGGRSGNSGRSTT